MTTAAQDTALAKPVVRTVYFLELQFVSGTQYLNSLNINIDWDSKTWLGLGTVGGMSKVEESDSVDAKSLNFSINHAQSSWLALAVGDVEDYRGQPAKLYFCPLDEGFQLIDTPQIAWRGTMDTVTVGMEQEEGKIDLRCETSAYGIKRPSSLRHNAAQQKKLHPADTGLDYLTDLLANPQLWLSKKFQRV